MYVNQPFSLSSQMTRVDRSRQRRSSYTAVIVVVPTCPLCPQYPQAVIEARVRTAVQNAINNLWNEAHPSNSQPQQPQPPAQNPPSNH